MCCWTEGVPVRWVSLSILPPPQAPFSDGTLKFPSPRSHPCSLLPYRKPEQQKGWSQKGMGSGGQVPYPPQLHRDPRNPITGGQAGDRPGRASAKASKTQPLRPPRQVGPIYPVPGSPPQGGRLETSTGWRQITTTCAQPSGLPGLGAERAGTPLAAGHPIGSPAHDRAHWGHVPGCREDQVCAPRPYTPRHSNFPDELV